MVANFFHQLVLVTTAIVAGYAVSTPYYIYLETIAIVRAGP
jgi:hypothetical protein